MIKAMHIQLATFRPAISYGVPLWYKLSNAGQSPERSAATSIILRVSITATIQNSKDNEGLTYKAVEALDSVYR
jgi:hypothetical protein